MRLRRHLRPGCSPAAISSTSMQCCSKNPSGRCWSHRDEIRVSKPFRVIEDGNHLWKHTVNRNFLWFRYRDAAYSGYLVWSKFMAFATSVGSVTGCAWAAIERPVIAGPRHRDRSSSAGIYGRRGNHPPFCRAACRSSPEVVHYCQQTSQPARPP